MRQHEAICYQHALHSVLPVLLWGRRSDDHGAHAQHHILSAGRRYTMVQGGVGFALASRVRIWLWRDPRAVLGVMKMFQR